jgi:hypothetical protein
MTALVYDVVPKARCVTYDGTNSADLDALLDITITGESGGRLDFTSGTGIWFAYEGWCLTFDQNGLVSDSRSPGRFADELVRLPDFAAQQTTLTGYDDRLDGLETAPHVLGSGAVTLTAAASGDTDVNVDIQPAQADTSYTPRAQIFGGVNLGNLSIGALTVVDENTVQVTVHNSGIVALGASVLVTAIP